MKEFTVKGIAVSEDGCRRLTRIRKILHDGIGWAGTRENDSKVDSMAFQLLEIKDQREHDSQYTNAHAILEDDELGETSLYRLDYPHARPTRFTRNRRGEKK